MLWTLWDVVVPMALAFGTGLLAGWLCWRWQRLRVSAEELHRLRRDTGRLRADNDRLRERLIDSQGRSRQRAEQKEDRPSPRPNDARRAGPKAPQKVPAARERPPPSEASRASQPGHDDIQPAGAGSATKLDNVEELQQVIESRDRMIDTLRHSLAQQEDESDPALMAAELSARDRKIRALEDLLASQLQRPNP